MKRLMSDMVPSRSATHVPNPASARTVRPALTGHAQSSRGFGEEALPSEGAPAVLTHPEGPPGEAGERCLDLLHLPLGAFSRSGGGAIPLGQARTHREEASADAALE